MPGAKQRKSPVRKALGGRPTRAAAELLAEKILSVATELMLEHGFDNTSMEAVAVAAGVAKRTLYSRFPDKTALFSEVIRRRRELFLAPVAKISAAGGSIEQQLTQIGNHMLKWGLKDDTIALKRLMAAEVQRISAMAATLHTESRERVIDEIAAVLAAATEPPLRITDKRFAAMQFLEMVMAPADMRAYYGFEALTDRRRRAYVDGVVKLFLNGCHGAP
jgi:AcrR family transcriptional regulator